MLVREYWNGGEIRKPIYIVVRGQWQPHGLQINKTTIEALLFFVWSLLYLSDFDGTARSLKVWADIACKTNETNKPPAGESKSFRRSKHRPLLYTVPAYQYTIDTLIQRAVGQFCAVWLSYDRILTKADRTIITWNNMGKWQRQKRQTNPAVDLDWILGQYFLKYILY